MTVEELIAQLKKYPSDYKIESWFPVLENYAEVSNVDILEVPALNKILLSLECK